MPWKTPYCLHYSDHQTRPIGKGKWTIHLVTTDGHFDLPGGISVFIYGLTYIYHPKGLVLMSTVVVTTCGVSSHMYKLSCILTAHWLFEMSQCKMLLPKANKRRKWMWPFLGTYVFVHKENKVNAFIRVSAIVFQICWLHFHVALVLSWAGDIAIVWPLHTRK